MEEQPVKKFNKTVLIFVFATLIFLFATAIFILSIKLVWKNSGNSPAPGGFKLSVTSPGDFLATSESSVKLTGETEPNSVVAVTTSADQKIIQTSNGRFSTQLTLIEGQNIVNITSFNTKNGQSKTIKKEILYLNEDLSTL